MNIRRFLTKICILILICISILSKDVKAQTFTEQEIEDNRKLGTIYIIGNNNLGKVEKYSNQLKQYIGVMPELFKKIEEISGLNFEYLQIKTTREQEIKNSQADLVSGIVDENLQEVVEKVKVFTLPNQKEVYIGFTAIASEQLRETVKKAVNSLPQDEKEQIILAVLQNENGQNVERDNKHIISIILVLIATLIGISIYIKTLKKRIRKEKYTDNITGYSNYTNFKKSFTNFIDDEIKSNYCLVDLGVDTACVEETYGYLEVERLLKGICDILDTYIDNNEMFCRKTNNSFLLLLDYGSQRKLEERIISINEGIRNYTTKYTLKCLFGIYFMKSTDNDLETATFYAMQARKNSAETGKLYTICNKSLMQKIDENYNLEKEIAGALKKKEFISYIQPIINIEEKQTVAIEFLARWENEKYGFIKPRRFLKILEKNNLIYELDLQMLKNACTILGELEETIDDKLMAFCNFSRNSFSKPEFVDDIKEILLEHLVNPNTIAIVITEDILTSHKYNIKKIVKELKELGLLIVLDNFGGTEDSINDIADLECDFIKIAPKLLNNIEEEKKQIILKQIINLARELEIEVICENIEKTETEQILKNMGCKLLQGNLYCQAIPLEEMNVISNNLTNV